MQFIIYYIQNINNKVIQASALTCKGICSISFPYPSLSQVIEVMNIKQKKEKKGGFTLLKGNARDNRFKGQLKRLHLLLVLKTIYCSQHIFPEDTRLIEQKQNKKMGGTRSQGFIPREENKGVVVGLQLSLKNRLK